MEYDTGLMGQFVADWLYSDWSKEKYETFKTLYQIPGIKQYFDYILDKRSDSEYMDINQVDWSDIHDPRKLSQTHSFGSMVNFVSSNVTRLYRDSKPKTR